jgi:hypothetical protein
MQPKVSYIYKVLASYIWIVGKQFFYPESSKEQRPLRKSLDSAAEHFEEKFHHQMNGKMPNKHIQEKIIGNVHITFEYFNILSADFQSIVSELGEFIGGDEKLLHFTGESVYIRNVKSKPDRIGFWYYELAGRLCDDNTYMLYIRVNNSNQLEGVNIPVLKIGLKSLPMKLRHEHRILTASLFLIIIIFPKNLAYICLIII